MQQPAVRRDAWPAAGLAAAAAFTVLAVLVMRSGSLTFDDPVSGFVRGLGLPTDLWIMITELGGTTLVIVGIALGLAALLTRRLRLVLIVAVVLIGASVFVDVVKEFVARPRPPGEHLVYAPSFSFPSGHSLNSASTYGLLAVVAWRSGLPLAVRRLAVVVGLVLPLCIGLSRVALGVHYPSDMLGGWLGGLAFVAAGAVLIAVLQAMEPSRVAGPDPARGPTPVIVPVRVTSDDPELVLGPVDPVP